MVFDLFFSELLEQKLQTGDLLVKSDLQIGFKHFIKNASKDYEVPLKIENLNKNLVTVTSLAKLAGLATHNLYSSWNNH